jgi:hypothetical protein
VVGQLVPVLDRRHLIDDDALVAVILSQTPKQPHKSILSMKYARSKNKNNYVSTFVF